MVFIRPLARCAEANSISLGAKIAISLNVGASAATKRPWPSYSCATTVFTGEDRKAFSV